METEIYLIRHAQSFPSREQDFHAWPLSPRGHEQAAALAELLAPLAIRKLYCSPFIRCRETIRPFAGAAGLEPVFHDGLGERLFRDGFVEDMRTAWLNSWEDFSFALPGGESSSAARDRFLTALREVATGHEGEAIGIVSHGNVIALLLNHLNRAYGREQAEGIRNPDVIKLVMGETDLNWHHDFELPGLADIASHHDDTPGLKILYPDN